MLAVKFYFLMAGMFAAWASDAARLHRWDTAIILGVCSLGLIVLNWRD